jgi:hypothetical protein
MARDADCCYAERHLCIITFLYRYADCPHAECYNTKKLYTMVI